MFSFHDLTECLGDEICVPYFPDMLFEPAHRRKAWLKKTFGFECQCERCVKPPEADKYLEAFLPNATAEDRAVYEHMQALLAANQGQCHPFQVFNELTRPAHRSTGKGTVCE